VAVPVVVGPVGNADSVGRVTQPTQGVATCAATVSLFVEICRLPGAVGLVVSPVHATVTAERAAMSAFIVIVMVFVL